MIVDRSGGPKSKTYVRRTHHSECAVPWYCTSSFQLCGTARGVSSLASRMCPFSFSTVTAAKNATKCTGQQDLLPHFPAWHPSGSTATFVCPLTRRVIRPISGRPASFRIVPATVAAVASIGAVAVQCADRTQWRSAPLQSRKPRIALVRTRRLRASLRCHLGAERAHGIDWTPRRHAPL